MLVAEQIMLKLESRKLVIDHVVGYALACPPAERSSAGQSIYTSGCLAP
jgi:hypothetical protein